MDKYNIYYFDIVEEFVVVGFEIFFYKFNDIYWNIVGNRLVAEVIDKYFFYKFFF